MPPQLIKRAKKYPYVFQRNITNFVRKSKLKAELTSLREREYVFSNHVLQYVFISYMPFTVQKEITVLVRNAFQFTKNQNRLK